MEELCNQHSNLHYFIGAGLFLSQSLWEYFFGKGDHGSLIGFLINKALRPKEITCNQENSQQTTKVEK